MGELGYGEERIKPVLADYLKASYPCIFLRTSESQVAERKVMEALNQMESGSETQVAVWRATTGFVTKNMNEPNAPGRVIAQDLIESILQIRDRESSNPIIGIFHNLRQLLSSYQNIQAIIDASMAAKTSGSCIIIVGPHVDLPPELNNIVTILDIPLPTQDQLVDQYRRLTQMYSHAIDLPESQVDREELILDAARAAIGLDELGAENAIALSMATAESIDIRIIQEQKEQEVKKSDVLEFFPVNQGLDDIGGFDYYKHWLELRRRAFSNEAREYGLPYPKGVLIVGPAGTGKSLTAKATSSFLRLPLLRLDMGKVFRSLVGESESTVRMALKVAEAVSPVVLWVDEIDKGFAGMKGSGELDSGVTGRVVSTILTWRQETTYPVMLAATANDVGSLPSMVYRKGRFDEVWSTDLPYVNEREEIFGIHIRKRGRDPEDYNLELLAEQSDKFTPAEIEGCIEDSMFMAFADGIEFQDSHILKAIRDTVPQAIRDAEELLAIREWASTRARKVSSGMPPKVDKSSSVKVRKLHTKRKTEK